MLEAKLKQLQDDVEAGRLAPVAPGGAGAAAAAAAAAGMATPPPGAAGAMDEGMMDRMRRFMQQIPGSSPLRDGTPMATPSGALLQGFLGAVAAPHGPACSQCMCLHCCVHLCCHPAYPTHAPFPCPPPIHHLPGRLEGGAGGAGDAPMSEMDRRQRELYAKQQQLLREQRTADQEKLLGAIGGNLGFAGGRPVAAVVVFRCCLQWKTFQADRTPLFDRIIATMGSQVGRRGSCTVRIGRQRRRQGSAAGSSCLPACLCPSR